MMKLSTMLKVTNTVDEQWKSQLAENILEPWGFDEGSVYAFRYSANFIFLFKKDGKPLFLRFNDVNERRLSLLKAEMSILEFLSETSLCVAKPVKSSNNQYVEEISSDLGTYYAVVFEALPGKQYEIEELQEDQYFAWGSALGELHETLKGMNVEFTEDRPSWKDHLLQLKTTLPDADKEVKKEIDYLLNWGDTLPTTNENFGLIHFDFELDNLRWEDGQIGILDFDDCANYWYVADIVYALRDLDEWDLEHPHVQNFLSGYRNKTKIDEDMLQAIPMFKRMHDLLMYGRLLRSVDILNAEDHPEWLRQLQEKLVNKIQQYKHTIENKQKSTINH